MIRVQQKSIAQAPAAAPPQRLPPGPFVGPRAKCDKDPPFKGRQRCCPAIECSLAIKASTGRLKMEVTQQVLRVLDEVLSLSGRTASFTRDTPLLGAIPELDSMAVVSLITALEEQFGIAVDDDDIDGETFATAGALADFVADKVARTACA